MFRSKEPCTTQVEMETANCNSLFTAYTRISSVSLLEYRQNTFDVEISLKKWAPKYICLSFQIFPLFDVAKYWHMPSRL